MAGLLAMPFSTHMHNDVTPTLIDRRTMLRLAASAAPLLLASNPLGALAADAGPGAAASTRGSHRSYRGKMLYITDGVGEMGREYFSVTVQADGTRTLRAQCEMDDFRLLRDVVLTVNALWEPIDAFVRLAIAGKTVGSSWFCFDGQRAEVQGRTAAEGRISRTLPMNGVSESFGTHALHGDSWVVGRLRNWKGDPDAFPLATFATSTMANGGSGPDLIPLSGGYSRIVDQGDKTITVPAGTFDTRHIRIIVPNVDDFDVWAGGEDCLPVKSTSRGLKQTYEMVHVEGDYR